MNERTPWQHFAAGVYALLPIALGVIPFGLVTGVTAVGLEMAPEMVVGMSLLFYAGAAQMVALQMLHDGALPMVIFATAMIINLRFLMYSASLAPYFHTLPRRWKWPLAYGLSDQAYALGILKIHASGMGRGSLYYFSGVAVSMWLIWQVSVVVGVLLGAQLPHSWSLDFAIPLMFLALLVPAILDRATLAAAIVGGVVAVLSIALPYNLGLMLAACCGIVVGLWVESAKLSHNQGDEDNEAGEVSHE